MDMLIRRFRVMIVLVFTCLLGGHVAAFQNTPVPDKIDRLKNVLPLSDAQKTMIRTYSEHWVKQLKEGDPSEVQQARNKLTQPFRSITGREASRMFRDIYSDSTLSTLKDIIEGGNAYRAINAMQVAAAIGTSASLSVLDNHIEPELEDNPQVRLWAAIGISRCLEIPSISSDKLKTSLRALVRAAEVEDNPLVLRREMETLDAAVRNEREDRQVIRDFALEGEIDILKTTIDRLESGKAPADLILAIQPSLLLIRNQYIDPRIQREKLADEIARRTAPQLGRLYDVILVNESTIRQSPELTKVTGQILDTSETTLKLMDSNLRNGQSAPNVTSGRDLWDKGNLSGLAESRDKWQVVLATRPYKN